MDRRTDSDVFSPLRFAGNLVLLDLARARRLRLRSGAGELRVGRARCRVETGSEVLVGARVLALVRPDPGEVPAWERVDGGRGSGTEAGVFHYRSGDADAPISLLQPGLSARVRQGQRLLAEHACRRIGLNAIVSVIGGSKFHFVRQFRRELGVPPIAFARLVRVSRAHEALLRGEAAAHVAQSCGYADQSHFSREHKKLYGQAPSHAQRALRQLPQAVS